MKRIELKVGQDHVESLAKLRNPLIAVEELIWNGLDADATEISIQIKINKMGGLDSITITDNGLGIPLETTETAFGSLGLQYCRQAFRANPKGEIV